MTGRRTAASPRGAQRRVPGARPSRATPTSLRVHLGVAPLSPRATLEARPGCASMTLVRFREAVHAELTRRCRQNVRYSMRGFARALGVHHATLSRLLGDDRPLQARTIQTLAPRLGFSPLGDSGLRLARRPRRGGCGDRSARVPAEQPMAGERLGDLRRSRECGAAVAPPVRAAAHGERVALADRAGCRSRMR